MPHGRRESKWLALVDPTPLAFWECTFFQVVQEVTQNTELDEAISTFSHTRCLCTFKEGMLRSETLRSEKQYVLIAENSRPCYSAVLLLVQQRAGTHNVFGSQRTVILPFVTRSRSLLLSCDKCATWIGPLSFRLQVHGTVMKTGSSL